MGDGDLRSSIIRGRFRIMDVRIGPDVRNTAVKVEAEGTDGMVTVMLFFTTDGQAPSFGEHGSYRSTIRWLS